MKLPTFTQKAGALTWLAGAKMNGLKKVFANNILTCIKSCEFHLKESCNRMAKKTSMMEDDGEGFEGLCDEMLVSSLKETIQEKVETLFCTMPLLVGQSEVLYFQCIFAKECTENECGGSCTRKME